MNAVAVYVTGSPLHICPSLHPFKTLVFLLHLCMLDSLSVVFPPKSRIDFVLLITQELFCSQSQGITLNNNLYVAEQAVTHCC